LCEIKSIRKPRSGTLLSLYNAKCYFHAIKHYTANNPKLQNIAMLLGPTILYKRYSFTAVNITKVIVFTAIFMERI
jgi:cytochrome c biogenesis factor